MKKGEENAPAAEEEKKKMYYAIKKYVHGGSSKNRFSEEKKDCDVRESYLTVQRIPLPFPRSQQRRRSRR